ncbi:MAG: hypothetical protein DLM58_07325 [Pseudonocardiales bacterium]|nr:MAG: hypothetical protein DLM58_07325 [Pseudonocardiales bacterium]
MSERQLFDLLAQDAPAGLPNLADEVIGIARQTRMRRWAVSGACVAVAVVAAIPLAIALNRSPRPTHGTTTGAGIATTRAADPAPSEQAQAYAAGVEYLTKQLVQGKHWRVLYVLEHTCENTLSPTATCRPKPIPADLQRDITAALRQYAPVQFVSDHAKIRGKDLQVINDGVAVTLGRIELHGDTARLPLAVQCGGLCGMGQTLLLAQQHGAWTVTGSSGSMWIS